jgi:hypothetical protein
MVFAVRLTRRMIQIVGLPCNQVVAKFTSAMFDGPAIKTAQVKAWWQRAR